MMQVLKLHQIASQGANSLVQQLSDYQLFCKGENSLIQQVTENQVHNDVCVSTVYPSTRVLYISGDGLNGSTSIIDTEGHTISVNGNTHISTIQSISGGSSIYFDGSGDYLWLDDSTDWELANTNYRIIFHIRLDSVTNRFGIMGQNNSTGTGTTSSFQIFGNAGKLGISLTTPDGVFQAIQSGTVVANTWYKVEYLRYLEYIQLFIDDVKQAETYVGNSAAYNSTNKLGIGAIGEYVSEPANTTYGTLMAGYLDEIEIYR